MRRREFITLAGSLAAALPLGAGAQQPVNKRIGMLMAFSQDDPEGQARVAVFRSELERLGWVSGRNFEIEYCWGAPNAETQMRFAKQLTAKGLDAILTHTTVSSVAMKNETSSVPIVFVQVSDPVNSRLVVSLSRPEGNVTGFTETGADTMTGKWLGLLKEIAPETKRVIALTSVPGASDFFIRTVTETASLLRMEAIVVPVEKVADFEPIIASQAGHPLTGLLITPDSFLTFYRAEITALAARYRLPAVYPFRYFATIGGLLSYGSDPLDIMRRAGGYIDRILRGEKPEDLAVQNPVKFNLVVNAKVARALNIEVPATFLARADEVIE